jgi:ADP-ribose pyrophosphatase YjhB (NUDIX family)
VNLPNQQDVATSGASRIALRPEEMHFTGHDTIVNAFTDPNQVPAPIVAELIECAVANRPDADALRQALIVRFSKALKMDDYGITVRDAFMDKPGYPSLNPQTVYVNPHPRPTAGSTVMTTYTDMQGETHVLLARKSKDGPFMFPGGYMEARMPGDTSGRAHDGDLDKTAIREMMEETGLELAKDGVKPKQLFVRSDCGMATKTPAHAIEAYYLADYGRRNEAPPVRAGSDVGIVQWVKLRDITRTSPGPLFFAASADGKQAGNYQVMDGGKPVPFKPEHVELLERGTQELREKMFPLHEPGNCSCCKKMDSAVQPEAHAHHDKLALAHGHKPMTITIEISGGNGWQQKMAERQAGTQQQTAPTIH